MQNVKSDGHRQRHPGQRVRSRPVVGQSRLATPDQRWPANLSELLSAAGHFDRHVPIRWQHALLQRRSPIGDAELLCHLCSGIVMTLRRARSRAAVALSTDAGYQEHVPDAWKDHMALNPNVALAVGGPAPPKSEIPTRSHRGAETRGAEARPESRGHPPETDERPAFGSGIRCRRRSEQWPLGHDP